MNLIEDSNNVIPLTPKRKIGFVLFNNNAKILSIEERLENIIKEVLYQTPEVLQEHNHIFHELLCQYPHNPYSYFGYANYYMDIEAYPEALDNVNEGLNKEPKNIDGILLKIKILYDMLIKDKTFFWSVEEFINKNLKIYPKSIDILLYGYSLHKNFTKDKEKENEFKEKIRLIDQKNKEIEL